MTDLIIATQIGLTSVLNSQWLTFLTTYFVYIYNIRKHAIFMWLDNTMFKDHLGMWDAIINLYVYIHIYIMAKLLVCIYIFIYTDQVFC